MNPDGQGVFLQNNAVVNGYTGSTEFPYKLRTQLNDTLQEIDTRRLLSSPLTRYSAFGRATYDIAENISVFAQGSFVTSNIWATGPPTPVTTPAVPRNPAIEPPALRALLDSRGLPNDPYRLTEVAKYFPNRTSDNDTSLFDFSAGVEGTLPNSDWTWEAYTQYGDTSVLTHFVGFLWDERRVAFMQAPNFGKGFSMPATAGSQVILTCTSGFPVYEPYVVGADGQIVYESGFELTQDCVDAVSANQTQKNKVQQRIFETNFQGKLADMKAGELRGAFGATTRWNESSFKPDPLYTSAVAAGGETDVKEIYGEILLPVVPKFELELGVRRSDFETAGRTESADTWKALFNWAATDTLRFRGGWQRAYRVAERVGAFQRPVEQSADLGGRRPVPQRQFAPLGQRGQQPESRAGAGALQRAHSCGGRSAGPKRVRPEPEHLSAGPDHRRHGVLGAAPRQSESRARACEHADHGRGMAIGAQRPDGVLGLLRHRARRSDRRADLPDRLPAMLQLQRQQQPVVRRQQYVLRPHSTRRLDEQ